MGMFLNSECFGFSSCTTLFMAWDHCINNLTSFSFWFQIWFVQTDTLVHFSPILIQEYVVIFSWQKSLPSVEWPSAASLLLHQPTEHFKILLLGSRWPGTTWGTNCGFALEYGNQQKSLPDIYWNIIIGSKSKTAFVFLHRFQIFPHDVLGSAHIYHSRKGEIVNMAVNIAHAYSEMILGIIQSKSKG